MVINIYSTRTLLIHSNKVSDILFRSKRIYKTIRPHKNKEKIHFFHPRLFVKLKFLPNLFYIDVLSCDFGVGADGDGGDDSFR